MKSNKTILGVISVVVVAGIIGVVVFAMNRDDNSNSASNSSTSNSNESTSSNASSSAVEANTVSIKEYAYSPAEIKVKKGTKVTWTNEDTVKHTVTMADDSKEGPKSELFGKGETYSYTFNTVGTFDYYCLPHPYMKATVTVTE